MTPPFAPTIRPGRKTTLAAGPWAGVRTTTDPFDDDNGILVDATNCYIPDPAGRSGLYSRPGFELLNDGNPVNGGTDDFRTQGVYTHIALDGTAYNFVVQNGRLYRVNESLDAFTDVTPVGIAIDDAPLTRIQFVSLADELGVSDGVNRPWRATALGSTPVSGTYLDFDGAGTAWTIQHWTVYGGAVVAILKTLAGIFQQTDIAWSEPGQMTVGWQQPDFDNRWTLEQTGSTPLYALAGTNVALYYFRQRSIGAISGAIGPDLATTATHDAISFNVGTETPQSIQQFGNSIFFTDTIGRPWLLNLGAAPTPIWLNMRAVVDSSSVAYPTVTAQVTTSAFEPTLNLYIVAIWSPTPSNNAPPVQMFVFDANTGVYTGRWIIGEGIAIECLGVFADSRGRAVLIVGGSKESAQGGKQPGGYLWSFNSLIAVPDDIKTEGDTFFRITTEGGVRVTAEGQEGLWTDNGELPEISAQTQRLGYSADTIWRVDRATIITDTDTPVTVRVLTTTTANVLEGTPSASNSADDTYRLVCGLDLRGRGTQVTVAPTTATAQWVLQQIQITATPSKARPEDA